MMRGYAKHYTRSTRERLCECIGIYRHVVVSIVLFFATSMYMYTVVWDMHKGPIQWDTENQYTGTKFTYKGLYGPMGAQCMYK